MRPHSARTRTDHDIVSSVISVNGAPLTADADVAAALGVSVAAWLIEDGGTSSVDIDGVNVVTAIVELSGGGTLKVHAWFIVEPLQPQATLVIIANMSLTTKNVLLHAWLVVEPL